MLEELHGKFGYIDCGYAKMNADVQIVARITIRAGRILYDPSGLTMTEWEKARPQYFSSPAEGRSNPATADDFPRH